ncbi:MAG: family 43 glycosylhydrolase [Candidatus Latescibacteria bacterium]|nr:family 43 glycosylhydrolase [Candidatus Latescibacterota bacterium]NIM22513.1 family 43 glycosylhydrolase [Candidatus Latescibacterota bacterium]NIM64827.1 family 43 glycosylhydrolase [Candidatus Latescibacterota bacterium]NIO01335.1 family 43 glycosylhydrolase [Candidatus Latescibacterota bacterium]NIO27824.1 family 43 glycosylhydrolase [Candidatus Latescibacterota bacterium]
MTRSIVAALLISALLLTAGASLALVRFDFEQPYFLEPNVLIKDHSLFRLGSVYHLFYLRGNPAISFGHATSTDLIHWKLEPPVLAVQPGTWDESGVWAPDIIPSPGPGIFMYYTGVNAAGAQQTGLAISTDLFMWVRLPWPVYHPDTSWAEWSEDAWCHARDPYVFDHDGKTYMLVTAKTSQNYGAIASAISDNYVTWQDNGPIYVHDSWHVLESVQCIYKNSKFHLFFTEEEVFGVSHMLSDSLYSGWDISSRTIVDLGQAAEVDTFDGNYLFSRHTGYLNEEGDLSYTIRFDTLSWAGDSPVVYKPWPLRKDWNLVSGIAFAFQPTFGNNPQARGDSVDVGFEGKCWIGSYERFQGPLMHGSPGGAQGDGATGLIRSNPFTIAGNSMNLLVGGGDYPDACYVALVDSATGQFLFKETGRNTDQMDRRYWDLRRHKGKSVYFEIADMSSDSFGHINVDDIAESMDSIDPPDDNIGSAKSKTKVTSPSSTIRNSTEFTLFQNAPNPFNPSTTISYYLPSTTRITLDIFDVNGSLVRRLADRLDAEGLHEITWDSRNARGGAVSTGIYFYRLTAAGKVIDTKKMILLK